MKRFAAVLLLVLSWPSPQVLAADPPGAASTMAKQPPFSETHYVRESRWPTAASVMPPQSAFHRTHYVRDSGWSTAASVMPSQSPFHQTHYVRTGGR